MTTDPFIDAARAERICMDKDTTRPFGLYCNRPEGHPGSHVAGSDYEVWDRPAAQEPTEAEIHAVMKVARTHYSMPLGVGPSFARAVIEAARAARRDEETTR